MSKAVLAYSGGLDTSVIIPWLKENYGCEVVAMAADVGQGDELDPVRAKALASGASEVFIEDLRHEFVADFIFHMLKAGAVYEGQYLLGTSIARPIIAKRQVEIAHQVGADAVVHGCTGKGNDQLRFELTYKAFDPSLRVIAPWREWEIKGRSDAIEYAKARNIPVPVSKEKPYSMDRNLWHISYEGGVLEDPWDRPSEEMYRWTVSPEAAPDRAEEVVIRFERGVPVAVDDEPLEPVALVERLNALGAKHGVGRIDIVENRRVGMKSRGCYETPGGTLLYAALPALESLTLDRDSAHQKRLLAQKYAELVYDGFWFTPLREALDAFVDTLAERVTGEVRLRLYKGAVAITGRRSPYSLYAADLATFEADAVYDQKDAAGFINLLGLPIAVRARLDQARRPVSKEQSV
ncbi:MAG TPA: argininosuccinate synthase [Limnochordia bacterium]|nr:argininosuccinate synthase [Limnochordia bacterium]